jgi:hypothetical protein
MQTISLVFGVVAAVLHGAAYVMYNRQAKLGQSQPNPISWSVWTFLAILNASSFTAMSDWVSSLQFLTGTIACILTFIYVLAIGKFRWPARGAKEWKIFGLGLLAAVVWYVFRSAEGANMIVLVAFVPSFFPTYDGVKEDPHKETALPWWIWTTAFVVTIVNLIIRDQEAIAFVMPAVLLLAHLSIAVLSRDARKATFPRRQVMT